MQWPCPMCDDYGMCQDAWGAYPCPMCSSEDNDNGEITLEEVLGKDRAVVYQQEYDKVKSYAGNISLCLSEGDSFRARGMGIIL